MGYASKSGRSLLHSVYGILSLYCIDVEHFSSLEQEVVRRRPGPVN